MAASQRKKLVYSVDTPFSTTQWPEISLEDQDAILELLCSLLTPIGQHRQRHVKPSEGKRAAKRKRKEEGGESKAPTKAERPPAPDIASFVDVGLTSITRNLEKLSSGSEHPATENDATPSSASPYAVIFVARSGQSSAFNSQLPQMVAVASKLSQSTPATRLVGYSKPCGDKLSACLGIPRVSSVGIRVGAPMSKALVEFVNEHVSPVRIAWLEEAQDAEYRQMQLKTEEKIIPKKAGKA